MAASRKKRAGRKPSAGRPRRRGRWRVIAAATAMLLVVAAGLYMTKRYAEISTMVDERRAAMSSSIWSAPHRLRIGDDVGRSQLVERLGALSYVPSPTAERPGQYSRTDSRISIYLRGFRRAASTFDPVLVHLGLQRGRISSVADDAGRALAEAMLEPESIGRLVPGAAAERVEMRLEDQKPWLVEGLLATEDQFFYWHPGFNPVRIVQAAVTDLREGRLAQGASTLTQQLARTFLERRERSFDRKLDELAVAIALELRLTKHQILERYINDVSMGAQGGAPIHGMPQAARALFNKDLGQVTPAEAATLIGMVQAPTLYNPRRHAEASTRRRNVVLGVMKRQGVIDEVAYAAAVASPMVTSKAPGLRRAPYFTDHVLSALGQLPGFDGDLTGLQVFTTLDAGVQSDTSAAVTGNLEKLEKNYRSLRRSKSPRLQSAAVVMDAQSGAIRAMVGGRSYAESQFNRASSALRQPGSAFKPIVYLAALDPSRSPISPPLTLASLLPDQPMSFGGWTPENHTDSYRIQATAVKALSDSLNVAAAYVGSRLGTERMVLTAHELGISQDLDPVLPISIGACETTLLELTSAYQAFANAGTRWAPWAIETIVDKNGKEVYRHAAPADRVIDPAVAYLVTGALKTAMESGTGASARRLGLDVPAAGKTGTTQDYRDAWFVGYTPQLVAGVWVGFDEPQSIGLTGAQAALPAWVDIVRDASAAPPQDFPVPAGIVMARIDPESGALATPYCDARLSLPFLEGTTPREVCPLHGGDEIAVAAAENRNWGGWRSSAAAIAQAEEADKPPRENVFRKVGKFFGSIFRR